MTILDDLAQLEEGHPSREVIERLLKLEGDEQQQLFHQAREVRYRAGVNRVTLRGVIEISNHCQKSCDYCAMRSPNGELERYRLTPGEILAIVAQIAENKIPIAFLQAGQDPACDEVVAEVIPEIKKRFGLHVLLCLGERPRSTYAAFAGLGADSYILKFETSGSAHYRAITRTSLAARLDCLRHLRELGYAIGTGNIVGLPGQDIDQLVDDVLLALKLEPDFVSASPFIANQSTPFETSPQGSLATTLNILAIYRIALRTPLIPNVSALEKIEVGGQRLGLEAGANVMTVNFTPRPYQEKFNIYSKQRFVVGLQHALSTIESAGMERLRASPTVQQAPCPASIG
ncbi:radical SAM protein [Cyanobium gracile UHCC 0139]|uniref:Radical SAM protein n=1 Tax=Cyanobium gracile UHCC 0139 TaxID=3110308 RepID=A0ABU5RRC4_9CYAN|nr:radical SAM protein [Cyanobium gracile]MEA5390332.1 radical SAM protein [Cyanobium gracile UHCC 0139]